QQGARQPISAFRVSFEYSNRQVAQKVTQELVRGFIDENIRSLSTQSTATTEFLKEQWEVARKTLAEIENRMTQFRLRNAGRLPDELQANLTTLRTLEQQLSGSNEAISRIGQTKLLLESQIRVYREQLAALNQPVDQMAMQAKSERLTQLEREIGALEAGIAALRERYTATHPDVNRAEAQLAMLKSRRDGLLKAEQEVKPTDEPPVRRLNPEQMRGARELEGAISAIQSRIQAAELELEERTKSQRQLIALIDQYNKRIQSSPLMEREYSDLTRDFNQAKAKYDELNAKKAQSEAATSLENRGQGERLQLLDPASLPETPTKPKRLMIIGAGAGLGLLLGIFAAGAREMKDTSLKNLKDARAYTNLPVLGTIPLLENDLVVRRKRRVAWLAWSAASILGILAMSSSVYFYYATKV
ncbi:MAG: GNVR domain-containing protein, partial [Bryobacteraceae bacterium]